ncbi:aldo/keto reductase [Arthrobacter sp. MYb229]|uniref:aldo/keto reductase n=1 Tax=unclassified Arthrobacter TaxID=235627 RepID=UPI000CFC3FBE|nr:MULTISPECIES: aldo/keto reductase [unclassified Arthrobacter]PRA04413.1 aldo/keto reductase [Arthrobacter sp. MYb229]PRB51673.1 aldo/keto reductase [Arthrobacter sp. MYb216]
MTTRSNPGAELVLGTMTFGDTADASTSAAILRTALDAGIRHIDTANAYVGGVTEELLAKLLEGHRDEVFLASKAGMPHADAQEDALLSPVAVRRSVEGSLRRLNTDRLDLFYLHQPDYLTPLEETMGEVAKLAEEGKILSLGVSNFAAWQIAQARQVAAEVGAPAPVVAQQLFNLVGRRIETEYLPFAAATGVKTMVYNPLGGGLLSGKHSFENRPTDGRFGDSRLAKMYTERYWDAGLFEVIDGLTRIAQDAGISLIELAFRWLAYHEQVDSLLLGGSKVAQLESNLAAIAKGPLDADIADAAAQESNSLHGPMPAYNR